MHGDAKHIVRSAQEALQDADGERWPAPELVRYLNDGQQVIATAVPAAVSRTLRFVPTAGQGRQTLPQGAFLLLDVQCNAQGNWWPVRKVDLRLLEASARGWRAMPPVRQVLHYSYSGDLSPNQFHLYPPPTADAMLDVLVAVYPDKVAEPAGPTWHSVDGSTGLDARWDAALLDYVLYRAWSKDAEYGANAALAGARLQAFTAQVGVQAGGAA